MDFCSVGPDFDEGTLVFLVRVFGTVEERKELKVLVLSNRVVLVRMALGTVNRGAHPDGHGRIHAIDDGNVTEFFVVGAAFAIGQRIAMKGRRDQLFFGWVFKQVAGNLFDCELIKWFVLVQ